MLFYQEKLLLIFFLYLIGGTIDNAQNLNDLRVPPANRLEQLHGNRQALELITSSEYVSLFVLENNFYNVEIVDYH